VRADSFVFGKHAARASLTGEVKMLACRWMFKRSQTENKARNPKVKRIQRGSQLKIKDFLKANFQKFEY
jgi:hypothetical protein